MFTVVNENMFCYFRWESSEDKSAFYTPPSNMQQSSGSELSNMHNFQGSVLSTASSGIDGVTHPNTSASSGDSYMER